MSAVLHDVVLGGRYVDRFEKRNEEWRIARRSVIGDWFRSTASPQGGWTSFVTGSMPASNIGVGGSDDPSFALLAT